ncbi:RelA/SpoT family protein [Saezia sanguinis]|uniref:RelA/SpoT family protein n=1 Tax=Saezia sanguinis TaxID=1965230 RepID=UPI001EF5EFEF|nr:bifunctional (p)ppGpp synthetase/guanosine-3',5'-bis(diphosphate) 3'-pyrophosphohydrolase [Saezia sanguinis]
MRASSEQPSSVNNDISAAAFAVLVQKVGYLSAADAGLLRSAYNFADRVHQGQFRSSGEPYVTHPIAVAGICAEWKLDVNTLMAALLHDSIEDCGISKEEIMERFGIATADIVDGVTKLDKMQFNTREEGQAESFRKMLLAMSRDVRVILVKLADRLHNMRTLGGLRPDKQRRIGRETMDIYAPIANRLGINRLYRELQDLSLKSIWPWRSKTLEKAVNNAFSMRSDMMQRISAEISQMLKNANLPVQIIGWKKNLYSLYRKMDDKQQSFAQVTDQFNFRIIAKSVEQCYAVMGALHQLYRPLTSRFKDYIAIPKVNGYQSLHTTLIGPASAVIEFQIRTDFMDHVAEWGVTTHWLYKATHSDGNDEYANAKWMQSLLDIQSETRDANEFLENVKVDLHPDAIYVFTPQSRITTLPQGATTVDFAYAIHSDVGDHCIAAKVNGEQVPLRTVLSNGDVVEIITSPVSHPNPAWLTFVRTGRARAKIRAHLKTLAQDAAVNIGEKMLAQSLRAEGYPALPPNDNENTAIWEKLARITGNTSRNELLSDIGLGKRVSHLVAKHLVTLLTEKGARPDMVLLSMGRYSGSDDAIQQSSLLLDGTEDILIQYARCCFPIPGDEIVGYLGHGEGLTIHTADCSIAHQLHQRDSERWLNVAWADETKRMFEVGVWVTVKTRQGLLVRISALLAAIGADIVRIDMGEGPLDAPDTFRMVLSVRNRIHLASALKTLRREALVLKAGRIKPPALAA